MKIGNIKKTQGDILIDSKSLGFNSVFLDNFTKLAILTVLAGYNKSNGILLNDIFSKKINVNKLNSFLSYIINHRIAPMKFNIRLKQLKAAPELIKNSDYNTDTLKNVGAVLNFSGGLDSTAGLLYAFDKNIEVLPLWLDFGQRNNSAEHQAVNKIAGKLKIKPLILKINLKKDILRGWKDWDFIIPGRNFLFLSLANSILKFSQLSKKYIYLCAHKDEMGFRKNKDKSQYFFDKASYFFSLESNNIIKAGSPFKAYSKSEIISYWRKNWEKKYKISPFDTITCYYGGGCGKCDACLKRAVYLLAGGYDLKGKVKINPLKDPAGLIKNVWIPRIKAGKMARNNKLDFIIAVEKSLDIVPGYLSVFYNNLSINTLHAVERRKLEIDRVIIK
jgi:7-cyano-7-deazaguanine synthase in queuosine biosynthesis